ncbi:MAG: HAMP domain-containing histidine kinase [Myxococcales bacterium FL481]|nr:MAG: HAMP domain-containing histidine kinase [Myxococcales bacterium FL481]
MAATSVPSRSLRVELLATLAIVLMMAVASLSFASEWLGQRRHERRELGRFQLHARSVAAVAGDLFTRPDRVDRDRLRDLLLPVTGSQLGVRAAEVFLVGPGGSRRLVGLGSELDDPPTLSTERGPSSVRPGPHGTWIIDEPIAVFARQPTSEAPVLRLVVEPLPYSDGPFPWHETLIVASGVGAILLVLGGFLLESKVLRPLRTIERATAKVRAGDREVRVPASGPTEFATLATSFNAMTAALRDQADRLEHQHQALQRAEKMATVGRLAAGVAHEFGNPLAAVSGYLDIVLDPRADEAVGEHTRELLTRVQTQFGRMQRIIRQLLDYSQPGAGEIVEVEVVQSVRQIASLVAADPRAKGVAIDVVGEGPLLARADPGFLQQVLLNLVVNGCLAARDGGESTPRVQIRAGGDPARVWIEVQDNGPGVLGSLRDELFEPFVSTRLAGEGTGLGLANSLELATRMHGKLSCLADSQYQPLVAARRPGAVFRLELPANSAMQPPSG